MKLSDADEPAEENMMVLGMLHVSGITTLNMFCKQRSVSNEFRSSSFFENDKQQSSVFLKNEATHITNISNELLIVCNSKKVIK